MRWSSDSGHANCSRSPPNRHSGASSMFSSAYYRSAPPWLQDWLLSARALGRKMARERGCVSSRPGRASTDRRHWTRAGAGHRAGASPDPRDPPCSPPRALLRDRFRTLGLDVQRMEFPRDLHRVPLLTKAEVRAAGRRLVADDAGKPMISGEHQRHHGQSGVVPSGSQRRHARARIHLAASGVGGAAPGRPARVAARRAHRAR